jgi:hypothetical protein
MTPETEKYLQELVAKAKVWRQFWQDQMEAGRDNNWAVQEFVELVDGQIMPIGYWLEEKGLAGPDEWRRVLAPIMDEEVALTLHSRELERGTAILKDNLIRDGWWK